MPLNTGCFGSIFISIFVEEIPAVNFLILKFCSLRKVLLSSSDAAFDVLGLGEEDWVEGARWHHWILDEQDFVKSGIIFHWAE